MTDQTLVELERRRDEAWRSYAEARDAAEAVAAAFHAAQAEFLAAYERDRLIYRPGPQVDDEARARVLAGLDPWPEQPRD